MTEQIVYKLDDCQIQQKIIISLYKRLTMNFFHMAGEILSSELSLNKIHVTPNTKIPQTNLNADLVKKEKYILFRKKL